MVMVYKDGGLECDYDYDVGGEVWRGDEWHGDDTEDDKKRLKLLYNFVRPNTPFLM